MTAFKRYELIAAARSKGWSGKAAGMRVDDFYKWLVDRGVGHAEIARIIRAFKEGVSQPSAPTAPAKDYDEQIRAIAAQLVRLQTQVENYSAPQLDETTLRALVKEAVAKASPEKVVLTSPADKKPVKITNAHPLFEKVLKLVSAGVNVLLVGPAGCGKTTLAHMVAKALKRDFGMLSCTSGASESQLTGWLLPVGDGKRGVGEFSYVASEFVKLYEQGNSVFLFDEFDAADPNMMLVINSALANGSLHVPQRYEQPLVIRGKNMAMIAAANTYGSGADIMYAGRNQLDAATLDRFYVVEMDYDTELERTLAPEEMVQWVWTIRRAVTAQRIRRVISTRAVMKMSAAVASGIPLGEVKRDLLAGWTRDELIKVGVAS